MNKKTIDLAQEAKRSVTAKEILQQPGLWKETIEILKRQSENIAKFVKCDAKNGWRIVITGAGTSAYVGEVVAPYLRKRLNARVESIATTDLVARPQDYLDSATPTIMVSCARSGNSPESVATYQLAKQCVPQLRQLVITCNADGELARQAAKDENAFVLLMPELSNDKGFAMTGSFSCMALTLLLLFELPQLENKRSSLERMIFNGRKVLQEMPPLLGELVELNCKRIVYLGTASLRGLAQEAALKTLELSSGKVVALSESVLGFRHGPKCIVDEETMVVMFLSNDPYTRQYDLDLLRELRREQGGYAIVAISYGPDAELRKLADRVFIVEEQVKNQLEDAFASLIYVLYAQMYAYFNSLAYGIKPDNPRPDGTVNRVVQGVTIYQYAN